MSEKRSKAINLSHHLSDLAKARKPSPLKGLGRVIAKPGAISLGGGLPHPDYFPFASLTANALPSNSFSVDESRRESGFTWLWNLFSPKQKTISVSVPKYPTSPDQLNLAVALQYGQATGLPQLQAFVKEFVAKVYDPGYSDWTCLADTGNTDGLSRAFLTLLNPGDLFLTEEWTYPSALESAHPIGCKPFPVAMDGEGMRAGDLRRILAQWDEEAQGARRPRVIYTVPIGQNPSGATMSLARKKEIYDVAVEYDLVIIEDDPYYFLQMKEYELQSERRVNSNKHDGAAFIASLEPSFVKVDTQGRVLRLDTFSKTIAPGARLGFFTCNPLFAERLERHGETSTQAPCGFGQSLITQLLTTWGQDGYVRWLHGLAVEYETRRNFILDLLAEEFHIRKSLGAQGIWHGLEILEGYAKRDQSEKFGLDHKLFSLVPPTAGMFVWIKIHFENLPSFKPGDEDDLERKLWEKFADGGIIIAPGWFFMADDVNPPEPGAGHFRISFANAEPANFKKAIGIFGEVLRNFHAQ